MMQTSSNAHSTLLRRVGLLGAEDRGAATPAASTRRFNIWTGAEVKIIAAAHATMSVPDTIRRVVFENLSMTANA
jgi:hypothetical protein